MRYALYVALLCASMPMALRWPFFGLCAYFVVSFMQPKALCWDNTLPDSMMIGVPLLIGAVLLGVRRTELEPLFDVRGRVQEVRESLRRNRLIEPSLLLLLVALLIGYIGMMRMVSPYPLDATAEAYSRLCKVGLITALMTGLAADGRRIKILYAVTGLSLCFWAIKGGIWTFTLGPHRTYGADYDNNLFALRSVMGLPLLYYVAQIVKRPRWRWVLLVCCLLTCLAIIGSRSRSGFVAMSLVLVCISWASPHRIKAVSIVALVTLAAAYMSWPEIQSRYESILAYRQDRSVTGRYHIWAGAWELFAREPVFGVGFGNFEQAYSRLNRGRWAAHNIWLQNLVELGLIGHPLWLGIIIGACLLLARTVHIAARGPAEVRVYSVLSRGLLLGLLAFWLHGMFHNEEYLDVMFTYVGFSVAMHAVVQRELRAHRLRAEAEHTGRTEALSVFSPGARPAGSAFAPADAPADRRIGRLAARRPDQASGRGPRRPADAPAAWPAPHLLIAGRQC